MTVSKHCLPQIIITPPKGQRQGTEDTPLDATLAAPDDAAQPGWRENGDGIPIAWSSAQHRNRGGKRKGKGVSKAAGVKINRFCIGDWVCGKINKQLSKS